MKHTKIYTFITTMEMKSLLLNKKSHIIGKVMAVIHCFSQIAIMTFVNIIMIQKKTFYLSLK